MIKALLESCAGIEDPRYAGFVTYPLSEMVLAALVGVMCGAEDWEEIALLSEAKLEVLRRFLPYTDGIASPDTFQRVFGLIDGDALAACLTGWLRGLLGPVTGVVAIDGKTLRGAKQAGGPAGGAERALHVLSAYAHAFGAVIGQVAVDGKSNEITAIPDLLAVLALEGAVVTIDALGTQKAIAAAIRDRRADYVLALKGNQGTLHDDVRLFFADPDALRSCPAARTVDAGHGRIEERRCHVTDDIQWLRDRHPQWPDMRAIVAITATRTDKKTGQTSTETRFYITSLPPDPHRLLAVVRCHWSIENNLHWMLDVTFGEDACQTRNANAALAFSSLRKLALFFLKSAPAKIPIKRKIKKACANNSFLLSCLC